MRLLDVHSWLGFGYGVGTLIFQGVGLSLAVMLYFLPAILGRRKPTAAALFTLNLFTGWIPPAWIGLLVWAVWK